AWRLGECPIRSRDPRIPHWKFDDGSCGAASELVVDGQCRSIRGKFAPRQRRGKIYADDDQYQTAHGESQPTLEAPASAPRHAMGSEGREGENCQHEETSRDSNAGEARNV